MLTTLIVPLILVPQTVNVSWDIEGTKRIAIAYIPEQPKNAPLVFIWHGHGGSAKHSQNAYAIHKEWPEAMVLYMEGLPTPGKTDPEGKRRGWQRLKGEQGDRDLKLFDKALDWAKATYKIDSKRVYSGGHSNGGAFTYLLWSDRREQIAAVAPSGAGFGRNWSYAKPMPALIIAGERDQIVPFENQMLSLKASMRINKCDSEKGEKLGPLMTLYKPASGGAQIVTYIYPGTHKMPDDTGKKMVEFFKRH